jgi:hypothetical protein
MKKIAQIVSWTALAGVIAPPVVYLAGGITLDTVKTWMLVFTILWFATTPLWMGRRSG